MLGRSSSFALQTLKQQQVGADGSAEQEQACWTLGFLSWVCSPSFASAFLGARQVSEAVTPTLLLVYLGMAGRDDILLGSIRPFTGRSELLGVAAGAQQGGCLGLYHPHPCVW